MSLRQPFTMNIANPIIKEKTEILLIILIKELDKYRKIAKGKINIRQVYILSNQLYCEKYIHLQLYASAKKNLENLGSDIIGTVSDIGKIFVKLYVFDNIINKDSINKKSKISNNNNSNTLLNKDQGKLIFVSDEEAQSLTKLTKKAIAKYKEENPDICKNVLSKEEHKLDVRHLSLFEKTNKNLQSLKLDNEKLNKNIEAKNKENLKNNEINTNKNLIENCVNNNLHILDKNNSNISIDNSTNSIQNSNKSISKEHFNDGLSDLSEEFNNEIDNNELNKDDNNMLLQLLINSNSELDSMVNKLIKTHEDKINDE